MMEARYSKRVEKRRGRPPLSESCDSKERILDVALALFSEKGFNGTSLKDIAGHLGMEASAIYGHFASKNELRLEIMQRAGPERLRSSLMRLANSSQDQKEVLLASMEILASHWLSPRETQFFRFLLLDNLESGSQSPLSVQSMHVVMQAFVTPMIQRLVDAGDVKQGLDLHWLTRQFLAPLQVMRQTIALQSVPSEKEVLQSELKSHVEHFFKAFAP